MKIQLPRHLLILATLMGVLLMPFAAFAKTPEPPFTSVMRDGSFEIRDYQTQVIAEVRVTAARGDPANQGFGPLARYIFGGNAPRAKIGMTAPVIQQQGQKIAMTAPVVQQAAGSAWNIRFIMPEGSTLATMPRPNDPNVVLSEVPPKRYAVIRFSGSTNDTVFARRTAELSAFMASRRLTAIGNPVFARYDPPWTPPFLKRNEVWFEVARP